MKNDEERRRTQHGGCRDICIGGECAGREASERRNGEQAEKETPGGAAPKMRRKGLPEGCGGERAERGVPRDAVKVTAEQCCRAGCTAPETGNDGR